MPLRRSLRAPSAAIPRRSADSPAPAPVLQPPLDFGADGVDPVSVPVPPVPLVPPVEVAGP